MTALLVPTGRGPPCAFIRADMTRRVTYCVVLSLAAAIGCRTKPYVNAHIESLNAEYRQLEDYVYALEEENARLQQERDALRAGNIGATRGDPAGSDRPGSAVPRRSAPRALPGAREPDPADEPPTIEIPSVPSPAPLPGARSTLQRPGGISAPEGELQPPEIELPQPGEPAEPLPLPAPNNGGPQEPETVPPAPADRRITQLFLNPALTTASKEDGLTLVIEPRNEGQQYVPKPGKLSIVALDPSRQGEAARLARWDFDAQATRQLLQQTRATPGIRLELPWPGEAPKSNRLHVYARYETDDGRRLQTDQEVPLLAPAEHVGRWTPRPPDRQRPATVAAQAASPAGASQPSRVQQANHERSDASESAENAQAGPPPDLSGEAADRLAVPEWSPHR